MASSAFDLRQFAPADVLFTQRKRGVSTDFRLNGDPDVDVIARMLRIEDAIGETSKAGDINAIVAAVQEGKQLIAELVLDADPSQDISLLNLNTQDVMTLFALVMHGGSVASAIAQALSRPSIDGEDGETPVITAENGHDETGADADAAPLVSASISSERSSTSADTDDGLPVTGTA